MRTSTRSGYDDAARRSRTQSRRYGRQGTRKLNDSSEKRLARALLLLARYGKPEETHRVLPRISQETLAEMIGTTRSRVSFFLNKFRKLGLISYNGKLVVHRSLLNAVLHEKPVINRDDSKI